MDTVSTASVRDARTRGAPTGYLRGLPRPRLVGAAACATAAASACAAAARARFLEGGAPSSAGRQWMHAGIVQHHHVNTDQSKALPNIRTASGCIMVKCGSSSCAWLSLCQRKQYAAHVRLGLSKLLLRQKG
jgi:hypothetical protein